MARKKLMQQFARLHIWLGWLVGVPILMWCVTGLFMVARPIEQVRGDNLRTAPLPIDTAALVFPNIGEPIREAHLVQQVDGPSWIITGTMGNSWRYSALDGSAIPPLIREDATRIAMASYSGEATLSGVSYLSAEDAPMELRGNRAAWQARFSDGTNLYIDDGTGEVIALRTDGWRLYDVMWGLHIMDLQTREDSSHPVLILFAALSAVGALFGCILLFRRRKARVVK